MVCFYHTHGRELHDTWILYVYFGEPGYASPIRPLQETESPMRVFWSIFFVGSLLFLSLDVAEKRREPEETPVMSHSFGDPYAPPTPRP